MADHIPLLQVKDANGTWMEIPALVGPKGPAGPQGPAGSNGKTPVKGTDYFTAADKADMVNQVKAALPTFTLVGTDENDVQHTWTLYGVAK